MEFKVGRDPRPQFSDFSEQKPRGSAKVPPWLEARNGGLDLALGFTDQMTS